MSAKIMSWTGVQHVNILPVWLHYMYTPINIVTLKTYALRLNLLVLYAT